MMHVDTIVLGTREKEQEEGKEGRKKEIKMKKKKEEN